MCALVREAIDAGAAGFSTSFSYAHRGVDGKPVPSRFADARRGRRAVPRRGRGRQGRGAHHAGRAVHLRRRLRVAAARRAAVHLPAVRDARAASTSSRSRCTSRAWRDGAEVWPQVTPRPLTMQFTLADPYSLNTGKVFGELLQGDRDGAHRRVPRSGLAGARGRRPRGVADEAALGDLRGLRVGSGSPSCRAGG